MEVPAEFVALWTHTLTCPWICLPYKISLVALASFVASISGLQVIIFNPKPRLSRRRLFYHAFTICKLCTTFGTYASNASSCCGLPAVLNQCKCCKPFSFSQLSDEKARIAFVRFVFIYICVCLFLWYLIFGYPFIHIFTNPQKNN